MFVESLPDAVCMIDLHTDRIVYANKSAERLFGYSGEAWAEQQLADLVPEAGEQVARGETGFSSSQVRRRDGQLITAEWCLLGTRQDSTGIAVFRTRAASEPVSKSERDPLTGLPNRNVFETRLQSLIDRQIEDFAVLFLDLDDFKQINDRFGHMTGDAVLRAVAERLIHRLRPGDTIARYGGDEFIVLLEGAENEVSAARAAQRLLAIIAEPLEVEGRDLGVGASVGIVLGPKCPDLAQTIRAADRALYRAKRLGAGRYVIFDERECPPLSTRPPGSSGGSQQSGDSGV